MRRVLKLREQVANVRSDLAVLAALSLCAGLGSGLAGTLLHLGLARFEAGSFLGEHSLLLILAPGIGAFLAHAFLRFVSHYRGVGIGDVIWSVHREGGHMPKRAMFTQMIASWLTVGSGGSAGPEGPIAFSGAALGANLGTMFHLSERRRSVLLACGTAGAISSIFDAPITGLLFAAEVVLRDLRAFHLLPVALSAATANLLAGSLVQGRVLGLHQVGSLELADLLPLPGLALAAGLIAVAQTRLLRRARSFFGSLRLSPFLPPLAGGLAVGAIGGLLPGIRGEGYPEIRLLLEEGGTGEGLALLGLLLAAKLCATSLTLGSGGCGGIFAPSLFLGACLGAAYHGLCTKAGLLVEGGAASGTYVLLGMAGLCGGILQAPLTAIFLVAEITGGYGLFVPLLLVTAISVLTAHRFEASGFYQQELREQGGLRALTLDARILADLSIRELMIPVSLVLDEGRSLREARRALQGSEIDRIPIVGEEGRYLGLLDTTRILSEDPNADPILVVGELAEAAPAVHLRDEVRELVARFREEDCDCVPVLDDEDRPVGLIRAGTLFRRYREELLVQETTDEEME